MALDRSQVVDAAWHILQTYGLGDLSMRRLARGLGVQPGALYWHVANKQELLAVLAQRMVAPLSTSSTGAPTTGASPAGTSPAVADDDAHGHGLAAVGQQRRQHGGQVFHVPARVAPHVPRHHLAAAQQGHTGAGGGVDCDQAVNCAHGAPLLCVRTPPAR